MPKIMMEQKMKLAFRLEQSDDVFAKQKINKLYHFGYCP